MLIVFLVGIFILFYCLLLFNSLIKSFKKIAISKSEAQKPQQIMKKESEETKYVFDSQHKEKQKAGSIKKKPVAFKIVISIVIIGFIIGVGIISSNVLKQQRLRDNRQAVVGDLKNLAASALAFYKSPLTHGGGAGFFGSADGNDIGTWIGFDWDGTILTTGNGTFTLAVAGDVLTIVGTGTEIGSNGSTNVQATMTVTGATSAIITTVNN